MSRVWRKEIWSPANLQDNSPRGWLFAFLRVLSITWTVFSETKVAARAAALSFSSLLGLGPLIAIAVLVGGFVLGNNSDPNLVANQLGGIIEKIAPQLKQLDSLNAENHQLGVAVRPDVVSLINGFIAGARSGSAGVLGAFALILIVLLLFMSVEDAFNDIWGVHLGRSLFMRVVLYWTILTLGAVLFFAAVALGAGTFVNVFVEKLPGGAGLLAVLRWSLPVFSVTLLVALLMLVYRVIPNTRVFWRAAFAGALVVTALLQLNSFVALLYVRRVFLERSLYGSLGILPVLMIGLYVFWLYVLTGSVISYAVQNVHLRNSQAAWSQLTEAMRERLTLVVLLTIGRRKFSTSASTASSRWSSSPRCAPPPTRPRPSTATSPGARSTGSTSSSSRRATPISATTPSARPSSTSIPSCRTTTPRSPASANRSFLRKISSSSSPITRSTNPARPSRWASATRRSNTALALGTIHRVRSYTTTTSFGWR
jgi:membrane protein